MIRFHRPYAILALLLFLLEVLIALFVRDKFIRPYGGDFLVVILIYCGVKTFADAPVSTVAFSVLLFAYAIEVSQYFGLINLLGLQHERWAILTMGKSFQWYDMLAYTLGITGVLVAETIPRKKH